MASDNVEFRKKIRAPKANYYLCDFHVHSPASSDIRTGKRFKSLSQEEQTFISEIPSNLTGKPVEYENRKQEEENFNFSGFKIKESDQR